MLEFLGLVQFVAWCLRHLKGIHQEEDEEANRLFDEEPSRTTIGHLVDLEIDYDQDLEYSVARLTYSYRAVSTGLVTTEVGLERRQKVYARNAAEIAMLIGKPSSVRYLVSDPGKSKLEDFPVLMTDYGKRRELGKGIPWWPAWWPE